MIFPNQDYFGQTYFDQTHFYDVVSVDPPYEGPVGSETIRYIRLTRNRMVPLHLPGA